MEQEQRVESVRDLKRRLESWTFSPQDLELAEDIANWHAAYTNRERESVPLKLYSEALDEIYRLRATLAYEARVAEACMSYSTLPVGVGRRLVMLVHRAREAARGRAFSLDRGPSACQRALEQAGAPATLTRSAFEAEAERRQAG